jgi:hypothetical protein
LDGAELFVRPPRSPQQPQRLTPRTPKPGLRRDPIRRSLPSQIAQRRPQSGSPGAGDPDNRRSGGTAADRRDPSLNNLARLE